jgi:hypothetical protein
MPHFDEQGRDTWICQYCANIYSDTVKSIWIKGRGNQCPTCAKTAKVQVATMPSYYEGGGRYRKNEHTKVKGAMSLYEYCAKESGLSLGSRALDQYINRYYGHQ